MSSKPPGRHSRPTFTDQEALQFHAQGRPGKIEIVATKPIESQAEADTLAKQTLEGIAKDMLKGSGSVVGLPDLRAGGIVEIDGMGQRFSGRYFVTSTTHTIGDGGYSTQFECRREEI